MLEQSEAAEACRTLIRSGDRSSRGLAPKTARKQGAARRFLSGSPLKLLVAGQVSVPGPKASYIYRFLTIGLLSSQQVFATIGGNEETAG